MRLQELHPEIVKLIADLSFLGETQSLEEAEDYIHHGEEGLALDTLLHLVSQHHERVPLEVFVTFVTLLKDAGIPFHLRVDFEA